MAVTISLRSDAEVEQALSDLGATPDGRNRSKIMREAILAAAHAARKDALRREALALASDPDDLQEVRATQAALEPLRAW